MSSDINKDMNKCNDMNYTQYLIKCGKNILVIFIHI